MWNKKYVGLNVIIIWPNYDPNLPPSQQSKRWAERPNLSADLFLCARRWLPLGPTCWPATTCSSHWRTLKSFRWASYVAFDDLPLKGPLPLPRNNTDWEGTTKLTSLPSVDESEKWNIIVTKSFHKISFKSVWKINKSVVFQKNLLRYTKFQD